ncbi:MAG: ATP-binding cassette domain-containing protein, partial [Geminicoccaceae bacterium]|nr:ATP-binding cassette domain-containing protein [Geminicoccaceae bacterium]
MSLLAVTGLRGGYGDVDILHGVSLAVEPGQIVVIVGPNGAGKSTALKAVFGLVRIRGGSIVFADRDLTGRRPDQIVEAGISFVPQTENVFPTLTVEENLDMGAYLRKDDIRPQRERVYELFPP